MHSAPHTRPPRLPPEEVGRRLTDVADALAWLHNRDVATEDGRELLCLLLSNHVTFLAGELPGGAQID